MRYLKAKHLFPEVVSEPISKPYATNGSTRLERSQGNNKLVWGSTDNFAYVRPKHVKSLLTNSSTKIFSNRSVKMRGQSSKVWAMTMLKAKLVFYVLAYANDYTTIDIQVFQHRLGIKTLMVNC